MLIQSRMEEKIKSEPLDEVVSRKPVDLLRKIHKERLPQSKEDLPRKLLIPYDRTKPQAILRKIDIHSILLEKKDCTENLFKRPWTLEEDKILLTWLNKGGSDDWNQVAKQIKGKKSTEKVQTCQQNESPDNKKPRWSREEDILIFTGCRKYGSRWDKIAKFVPGRTEDAIRNRLYSLLKLFRLTQKKSNPLLKDSKINKTELKEDLMLKFPDQKGNQVPLINENKENLVKEPDFYQFYNIQQNDFALAYNEAVLSQKIKLITCLFDSALSLLTTINQESFSKYEDEIEHLNKIMDPLEKFAEHNIDSLILSIQFTTEWNGQKKKIPDEDMVKNFITRTYEATRAVSTVHYYYRMNFNDIVKRGTVKKEHIEGQEEVENDRSKCLALQLTSLDSIIARINGQMENLQRSFEKVDAKLPEENEVIKKEETDTTNSDIPLQKSASNQPSQPKLVLVIGSINPNLEKISKN